MKINKTYSIEKIPHNFVVVKRTKNKGTMKKGKRVKPKKKYRETKKFFPSFLRACLHIKDRSVDVENMETIAKSLDKTTKQIIKAVSKLEAKNQSKPKR